MSDNLLNHLFGEQDTMEVRKDMEKVGVNKHLWLQRRLGTTIFFKPTTTFVFTQEENKYFLEFVSNIHAPIGYSTAFKKHVGPKGCLP